MAVKANGAGDVVRGDGIKGPKRRLAAVVIVGLAIRLYMSWMAFASTFDTSTVGLMALHILKGERPLFYYGQSYMGALEAYVAAALFTVFGVSEFVLSLSPILFSLGWIAATFLLFRELAGDTRAGLAAALCAALPGWETLWYNVASYGGYPAAFFFGTLALWLAVRLAFRELSARGQWGHALALGVAAALGVWTHYLAGFYLLTGAVVLLARLRGRASLLPKLAAGAVVALAGLVPALVSFGKYGGEQVVQWNFSWGFIKHNAKVLLDRNVPQSIFWPVDLPEGGPADRAVKGLVLIVLGAAIGLWLLEAWTKRREQRTRLMLVAVLFALVFLPVYLPHLLAFRKAARYVIPAATLLLCSAFAFPLASGARGVRRLGAALLAIWLAYNAVGAVAIGLDKRPRTVAERDRRQRLVESVEKAGLKTVAMVGGEIFGHEGQTLSFYAGDRVHFVSVFDERYQPAAQAAEADPVIGLACERAALPKMKRALGALEAECRSIEDPWVSLFHDVRVQPVARRAVPLSAARVTLEGGASGSASAVIDRVRETAVEGPYSPASGFTIDLGRTANLSGLWLCAPDLLQAGLPDSYVVSVSLDGKDFCTVTEVKDRTAVAYVSGPQVYMKGYFGLLECRFEPVPARVVRFEFSGGQGDSAKWTLSEVFLFEQVDPQGGSFEDDVAGVLSAVQSRRLDFTWCDRWLSARLLEARGAGALPRFNPKYKSTRVSRVVVPKPGTGVAVSKAVADECAMLLGEVFGEKAVRERLPFGNYELLVLGEASGSSGGMRLVWNGHTLLRTVVPEDPWPEP